MAQCEESRNLDAQPVGVANLYYYYRALGVLASQQHRPIGQLQRELGYLHVAEADRPTIQRWSRDAVAILLSSPGTSLKAQLLGPSACYSDQECRARAMRWEPAWRNLLHLAALCTVLLLTA